MFVLFNFSNQRWPTEPTNGGTKGCLPRAGREAGSKQTCDQGGRECFKGVADQECGISQSGGWEDKRGATGCSVLFENVEKT